MYLETWKLLDIAPTRDKHHIHKAYNQRRKVLAEDAFELSRLLTAYEEAIRAADDPKHPLHQQILEDETMRDAALMASQFSSKGPPGGRRLLYALGQALTLFVIIIMVAGYLLYMENGDGPATTQTETMRPTESDLEALSPLQQMHRGLLFNNAAWVQKGLAAGADPGSRLKGRYLLHLAVENNNLHGARLLLEAGCEVDLVNEHGDTALHMAVNQVNSGMVKVLLRYGADPNHRNKQGVSPLELAEQYQGKVLYNLLQERA